LSKLQQGQGLEVTDFNGKEKMKNVSCEQKLFQRRTTTRVPRGGGRLRSISVKSGLPNFIFNFFDKLSGFLSVHPSRAKKIHK
jgi:hypothetical protein